MRLLALAALGVAVLVAIATARSTVEAVDPTVAVVLAAAGVAFGPVALLAAVLWWPISDEGTRRAEQCM